MEEERNQAGERAMTPKEKEPEELLDASLDEHGNFKSLGYYYSVNEPQELQRLHRDRQDQYTYCAGEEQQFHDDLHDFKQKRLVQDAVQAALQAARELGPHPFRHPRRK